MDLAGFLAGFALVDLAGFLADLLDFAAIVHRSFGTTQGAVILATSCLSLAPGGERQLKDATLHYGVRTLNCRTFRSSIEGFLGPFADSVKRKS